MKKQTGFLVTTKGWGGLEINVLRLAIWLKQNEIPIILFTIPGIRIYEEAKNHELSLIDIPDHRKYFDFGKAHEFSLLLKKNQIQNLFIFDNRDIDFANLTKIMLRNRLNLIYQQHMQMGVSKKDLIHTFRYSGLNYWISPLDSLRQEVIKKTHINKSKIKVIPLGVDIDRLLSNSYTKSEARKKLGINPTSTLIGIIGRIDRLKGQLFLVEALHQLQSIHPLELLIMGDPTINDAKSKSYFESINQFIEAENLKDKIHIRRFSNDVQSFYNAIDIFALASHSETYGMVTIEAMLHALPIIATQSGGTSEILRYGEFGTLYVPEDTDDFCTKLNFMLTHPEETSQRALRGQAYAKLTFSHKEECKQIIKLIII